MGGAKRKATIFEYVSVCFNKNAKWVKESWFKTAFPPIKIANSGTSLRRWVRTMPSFAPTNSQLAAVLV